MKSLYESLLDDFDTLNDKIDPKEEIEKFLEKNYIITGLKISTKPSNGKYIVNCKSAYVLNKQIEYLTNDLFAFGNIQYDFSCMGCASLKSLEGSPNEVQSNFFCKDCTSLKSLEGSPKYTGGFNCTGCSSLTTLKGSPEKVEEFNCTKCNALTSLEGAPKEILSYFVCTKCENLKSLKGAPKKVGGGFDCSDCAKLTSLKGAPEYSYTFQCSRCGRQFTEEEVRSACEVKSTVTI